MHVSTPFVVAKRLASWYFTSKPHLTYLLLCVTFRCNSRCIMCNIWQGFHDTEEMTLDDYAKLSQDQALKPLRELDLTGGETFMREDLADIIKLFARDHKLYHINVPTNGFLTDRILTWYHDVRQFYSGLLRVGLSIDGYGDTHETIRRVPHAWDKVLETWRELEWLMQHDNKFEASVFATIVGDVNIHDIPALADMFGSQFMFRLSCANSYLGNDHKWIQHDPAIIKQYSRYYERYCRDNNLRYFHRKLISYFTDRPHQFIPCRLAVNAHCFIHPNGDVYPCVESWSNCHLGNVRTTSLNTILHSKKAREAKQFIARGGCYCIADCMYLRNLKIDPHYYLWRLKENLHFT